MSCIPYTTQAGPICSPEGSQPSSVIFIIHSKNMTPNQMRLMKDCQDYLHSEVETSVKDASEIGDVPTNAKFFVIPSVREELVKRIRKLVVQHKPCIYTPRAIIEARIRRKIRLPVRSIAISLTMYHCHVFLTKSCNLSEIRTKINEMCGTVVASFKDPLLNVVITDRADDRYCIRARQLGLACVTRAWVFENHRESLQEDEKTFDSNALVAARKYHAKPFYGLVFKISTKNLDSYIRNLIAENQGRVVYGDSSSVTHEVVEQFIPSSYEEIKDKSRERICRTQLHNNGPKKVDVTFIQACSELGYYLTLDEYREYRDEEYDKRVTVKQEPLCQLNSLSESTPLSTNQRLASISSDECFTPPMPPTNSRTDSTLVPPQTASSFQRSQVSQRSQPNENQSMLPPPSIPRQTRLQQQQQQQQQYTHSDSMSDVILKALSGFENGMAQTQLASTQMRGLPERTIQIERTMEPSQQLYWSDTVSRHN